MDPRTVFLRIGLLAKIIRVPEIGKNTSRLVAVCVFVCLLLFVLFVWVFSILRLVSVYFIFSHDVASGSDNITPCLVTLCNDVHYNVSQKRGKS